MKKLISALLTLFLCLVLNPLHSVAESSSESPYKGLNGTMTPLLIPDTITRWWPDSLSPCFLNHIGRHGARFLSSESKILKLEKFLRYNAGKDNLSPDGLAALAMIDTVKARTGNRWGALTKLGREEEQKIARLSTELCPGLFGKGRVVSISSYVPRVVESQYSFCLQLADLSSHIEISTDEGRQYDSLLRPFDYFHKYKEFRENGPWKAAYEKEVERLCPTRPVTNLLIDSATLTDKEARALAMDMYGILQGMEAADIDISPAQWFSPQEYGACARLSNLARYCRNSQNRYSDLAPISAIPLLEDILDTGRQMESGVTAALRFGHDETLMPLLSLMDIGDCFEPDAPIDADPLWFQWNSSRLFPLAANLQLIYLSSPSGRLYIAAMLNEAPVEPYRGAGYYIVPLEEFRRFMQRRIAEYSK